MPVTLYWPFIRANSQNISPDFSLVLAMTWRQFPILGSFEELRVADEGNTIVEDLFSVFRDAVRVVFVRDNVPFLSRII